MRKVLLKSKDELSDYFFDVIEEGCNRGKVVDGCYLSEATQELGKSMHMTSLEISHFVKRFVLNINFENKIVKIEKKSSKTGGNLYRVVNLDV